MADYTGSPSWQAECDMSEKDAIKLFDSLKQEKFCEWAELVSEDDDSYMDIIDSFDNENAREAYRVHQEMKKILEELFC